MKISQPKRLKPMFSLRGITVTTLREKNKIKGWEVNGETFMVKKGTLLETWKKTETYINKLLK